MSIVALKRKTSAMRNISHNKSFSLGHRNIYTSRKCCSNIVDASLNHFRHTQGYIIKKKTIDCIKKINKDNDTASCSNNCPSKSVIRYPVLMWKRDIGAQSYETYLTKLMCSNLL